MLKTEQNNPHHCFDVGHHSLAAVSHIQELYEEHKDAFSYTGWTEEKILTILVYGALLHDVAKPDCRTVDEEGIHHFHGHPEAGAKKAKQILRRLKFDNETIDRVVRLVRSHDVKIEPGERNMRFALNRLGPDLFPELFLVKEADLAAQSDYQREEKHEHLRKMQEDYEAVIASGACLTLKGLAVNGKDLIGIGMQAGRGLGDILQKLLEEVLEETEKNEREWLMSRALEIYQENINL